MTIDARLERMCGRKLCHRTENRAHRFQQRINRRFGDAFKQVYHCDFCGFWHIGSPGGRYRRGGVRLYRAVSFDTAWRMLVWTPIVNAA